MIRALLVAAAIAAAASGGALVVSTEATQSLAPATFTADCPPGDYANADGTCVPVPAKAPTPPSGATYQCVDGTYSSSQHLQGACSRHGGVDHPL
jgi:hypothetical protein